MSDDDQKLSKTSSRIDRTTSHTDEEKTSVIDATVPAVSHRLNHHHAHVPASGDDKNITDNTVRLVDKDGHTQRWPLASNDPRDPLNFGKWTKLGIVVSCCWLSIFSLALAGGLGPIMGTFYQMYHEKGPAEVTLLSTLPSVMIGVGNLIVIPASMVFGRRPVVLVSAAVLMAGCIGSAASQSFEVHLATRIVQGLASGISESLLPLMITEISFVHERSRIFAIYWASQNVFSSGLNLAGSYEVEALGFRAFYVVYAAAAGAGIIMSFLFLAETGFNRPPQQKDGVWYVVDRFGVNHAMTREQLEQAFADKTIVVDPRYNADTVEAIEATSEVEHRPFTWAQRLKPWSGVQRPALRIAGRTLYDVLMALFCPTILYVTLLVTVVLGTSIAVSLTYSTALLAYGWPAQNIGLIAIGAMIGAALGSAYAGFFGDKILMAMTRRNHGVLRPGHYLVVSIFPGVVAFASLLLYAFTASGNATWGGPVMAWALNQFSFTSMLIITSAYATIAYPDNPGAALLLVIGAKNIISYGITQGTLPMVMSHSNEWAYGVLAAILGASFLVGLPFYFWGDAMDRWAMRQSKRIFHK
ncbi:uncharacterized protein PFL1_05970 [Pseudozyma flocculosa PF-1]|uniref:Major facilitator superfamily (MFS) profile domain-containing protein n=1 Tax=Pseudozyma flocculosa PF-1 TaxID=1277687 RepID=A0A061H2Z6_9BASI|nr:uncharacterized protein PFL1_05970 [Pseudozyma flocculosa PF-1]EPQ26649.1 hypothetical protein PFL1_05970 [Pseudozyma flocculosa PF-1]